MAFHTAQTFTFGEQPSASKWQYIWDNDYALQDWSAFTNATFPIALIADNSITMPKISNPYKFRAYSAGDQNINDATDTKITFGSETYDTNNNFASSGYTVPVTGYYNINCAAKISTVKGAGYKLTVKSDSTTIMIMEDSPYPAANTYGFKSLSISDVQYLTAEAVITAYAYCDTSDSSQAVVKAGSSITYISGHLVSI